MYSGSLRQQVAQQRVGPAVIADGLHAHIDVVGLKGQALAVVVGGGLFVGGIVELIGHAGGLIPTVHVADGQIHDLLRLIAVAAVGQTLSDHVVVVDPHRAAPQVGTEGRVVAGNGGDGEGRAEGIGIVELLNQLGGLMLVADAGKQGQEGSNAPHLVHFLLGNVKVKVEAVFLAPQQGVGVLGNLLIPVLIENSVLSKAQLFRHQLHVAHIVGHEAAEVDGHQLVVGVKAGRVVHAALVAAAQHIIGGLPGVQFAVILAAVVAAPLQEAGVVFIADLQELLVLAGLVHVPRTPADDGGLGDLGMNVNRGHVGHKAVFILIDPDGIDQIFAQGGADMPMAHGMENGIPQPEILVRKTVGGGPDTAVAALGGVQLGFHNGETFGV